MRDLNNRYLKSSRLVQEQERFNKRMNNIASVLGVGLMLFCAIWWIDGMLG